MSYKYYIEVNNLCNVQQSEEIVFASQYFDTEKEAINFFKQMIAYINKWYGVWLVTVEDDKYDVIKRKLLL